jgi:subtilisin family serine protease
MSDSSFGADSPFGGSPADRRSRRSGRQGRKKRDALLAAALEPLESRSMLAANVLDVAKVMWNGKLVEAVRNEYVLRMPQLNAATAKSPVDYVSRTPTVQPGWSVQSIGSGFYKLTAPGATNAQVNAWSKQVGARYIDVNTVREYSKAPNDPLYGDLGNWAFPKMQADKAWDTATGTPSTIVAVLDSGVDYNHPDLASNMWKNPNETAGDGIDNDRNGYIDDIYGINADSGSSDPMDQFGHGTFCAGLIGAVGNNSVGMAGVNWSVQIMAVSIGTFFPTQAGIIAGANYIAAQRVAGQNIAAVNCSFGGPGFSQAEFDAMKLMADSGIVVVCAAGNDGTNNDLNPTYPANYSIPQIISVAASTPTDQLTGFSNYGATTVDLAAPGEDVLSTVAAAAGSFPRLPANNQYGLNSGTSFSAPMVAGTAGLLKSIKPAASAQQVKDAILGGVDKLPALAGKVLTGGRLNVASSVVLINATPGTTPTASFKSGQGLKYLEGNSGFAFADVKVVLDRPCDPGKSAAVWFDTQAGGSAVSGGDFVPQSGFVTFSGKETEKSIRIQIIGERTPELDEQFVIKLDSVKSKGVAIGDGLVTLTILDDDNTANPSQPGGTNPLVPILSLAPKMQADPANPGQMIPVPVRESGLATYVISLDRTSNKTISVKYRTTQPTLVPAGTALAGVDYVATSGTMTFRPGEQSKEFIVKILADKLTDNNETFRVVLTEPLNAELAGGSVGAVSAVTTTITDVGYVPPPAAGFQIALSFPDASLTPAQRAVFQQAANRWQEIIVGDLPNVTDPSTGQVIDDILILATAPIIDGAGGILGQAGPTEVRTGAKGLPWKGVMEFDSADVAVLEADGTFKDVVLHEMGHVLGFGTLWQQFGLVTGLGGTDPLYVGTNALREYRSLFGVPAATGVPVENQGGAGTAGGHWRESVFDTELMTGFAEPAGTRMPISRITVGAMQDLGYQVNYARADAYVRPAIKAATPAAGTKPKVRLASLAPQIGAAVTTTGKSAITAPAATTQAPRTAAGAVDKLAFAALLSAVPSQSVGGGAGKPSGRQVFAAVVRA